MNSISHKGIYSFYIVFLLLLSSVLGRECLSLEYVGKDNIAAAIYEVVGIRIQIKNLCPVEAEYRYYHPPQGFRFPFTEDKDRYIPAGETITKTLYFYPEPHLAGYKKLFIGVVETNSLNPQPTGIKIKVYVINPFKNLGIYFFVLLLIIFRKKRLKIGTNMLSQAKMPVSRYFQALALLIGIYLFVRGYILLLYSGFFTDINYLNTLNIDSQISLTLMTAGLFFIFYRKQLETGKRIVLYIIIIFLLIGTKYLFPEDVADAYSQNIAYGIYKSFIFIFTIPLYIVKYISRFFMFYRVRTLLYYLIGIPAEILYIWIIYRYFHPQIM